MVSTGFMKSKRDEGIRPVCSSRFWNDAVSGIELVDNARSGCVAAHELFVAWNHICKAREIRTMCWANSRETLEGTAGDVRQRRFDYEQVV